MKPFILYILILFEIQNLKPVYCSRSVSSGRSPTNHSPLSNIQPFHNTTNIDHIRNVSRNISQSFQKENDIDKEMEERIRVEFFELYKKTDAEELAFNFYLKNYARIRQKLICNKENKNEIETKKNQRSKRRADIRLKFQFELYSQRIDKHVEEMNSISYNDKARKIRKIKDNFLHYKSLFEVSIAQPY